MKVKKDEEKNCNYLVAKATLHGIGGMVVGGKDETTGWLDADSVLLPLESFLNREIKVHQNKCKLKRTKLFTYNIY